MTQQKDVSKQWEQIVPTQCLYEAVSLQRSLSLRMTQCGNEDNVRDKRAALGKLLSSSPLKKKVTK